jgi:hypothetical protein
MVISTFVSIRQMQRKCVVRSAYSNPRPYSRKTKVLSEKGDEQVVQLLLQHGAK